MRRLIAVLVSASSLLATAGPSARAEPCDKTILDDGSVVTQCAKAAERSASSSRRPARTAPTPKPLVQALSRKDDQACTIYATATSPQGKRTLSIEQFLGAVDRHFVVPGNPFMAMWRGLLEALPGCAGAEERPEAVVAGFLVTLPLPQPRPHIAPGYALAGKPAYLETRGIERKEFSSPTAFGVLRVLTERSAYLVDWGDGSGADRGPFPHPGEAWPAGRITHTYTHTGRYDVTVTQLWQAHWSLGPASGTVTGLRSAPAVLEDFEVRQLQAVRNR